MTKEEIYKQLEEAVKLTEAGKNKEAMEIYEKLLEYEIPEVYNNIGNLYRREGLLGKAIEMYKKAIQISPDFALAYFNLGCALMELDKYNEAVMFFEKSERLGMKSFDLDVQLTLSYIGSGNLSKAKEKMKDERVRNEVSKYIDGGIKL